MTSFALPDIGSTDRLGVETTLRELIALRGCVSASAVRRDPMFAARSGNHASIRRGRGMEFAEVRTYQHGDDVRAVDWRQTARRGRLYTKLFQEEHERPVRLLVDQGASMRFGTRVAFKSVVAARAAAWLAWRAVAAGDRVGGVIWNGAEPREIRPQDRHHGVLELLRCLADASSATPPAAQAADMAAPLRLLARNLRTGSLIVVISDFTRFSAEAERQIDAMAGLAELVLIHVYDSFETQPPPGCYRVTDGRRSLTLDLRSDAARAAYGSAFAVRCAMLEKLARRTGAALVQLATHAEPAAELARALPGYRVTATRFGS